MNRHQSLVIGCDHVSVLVSDLDRSCAFYEQVLGLQRLERPDLGFAGAWLALGGGIALHLLVLPNPDAMRVSPAHAGRDRHLALRVPSLDQATQTLSQAGVLFTRSTSGRASIFCRDPDGNGVELTVVDGSALALHERMH